MCSFIPSPSSLRAATFAALFLGWMASGEFQSQIVFAQSGDSMLAWSGSAKSQLGQRIVSWPSDPMMSAETEAELFRALMRPMTQSVTEQVSLEAYTKRLSVNVPIHLDVTSLEGIGLTEETTVSLRQHSLPVPLARKLLDVLNEHDLTLSIRGGLVMVQTHETAEGRLNARVYDVTPIISRRAASSSVDQLFTTIQNTIEPDVWEALGGTSTMTWYAVSDRVLLVISAGTVVHWQVNSLLNRLNLSTQFDGMPGFRVRSIGSSDQVISRSPPSSIPRFRGSE